uniref:cAMP-dependent protein kinase type II regulatory subunit n=1 Tax=Mesocestoides corti TaxID=53468 RepID=A0A5K3ETT0_MESCO
MPNGQPDVPDGLIQLLQDFTVAILRNKPENIPLFAVEYFTQMDASQDEAPDETDMMDDDFAERMFNMAAKQSSNRRASVAAERFNPDDDDDDDSTIGRKTSFHEKTPDQIQRLRDVCKKIVLFSELDDKELTDVINAMFMKKAEPGENVIEQYDNGDNFYVIDSGKFEAKIDVEGGGTKVVKEYDGEGFFGELALMYNAPRSATVTAVTEGILWALSRQSFRKLVLGHAARRRRAFVELLHSVRILQDLTPYQRMSLADNLQRKTVASGDIIIREGDPGEAIFFVMDGIVRVTKQDGGQEKEITRIEKGGYFGELALLSNKPRAASVYADTDVTLAVLGVESFERLLGPCISLMQRKASVYKRLADGT